MPQMLMALSSWQRVRKARFITRFCWETQQGEFAKMGLAIRLGWIYGAIMNDTKNTQAMPIDGDDAGLITMDLTGLKCPLPVLKARRQICQMPTGGILVVIADDPAAPLDFDHFCQTGGHDLLESVAKDGVFIMRIAKALA